MSSKKKILINLGDEKCPHCVTFGKWWKTACTNENITKSYHVINFVKTRGLEFPRAFDNFRTIPSLFIMTEEEYSKRWNIETNQVVNQNLVIDNYLPCPHPLLKNVRNGTTNVVVPNDEEVLRWILSNR